MKPRSMKSGIARWDERYATEEWLFGTAPNRFLQHRAGQLPAASKVLAVADGEGRNGVFLAEQGHEVTSVDGSANAIAKARKLARERGCSLNFEQVDLLQWDWPVTAYDAVIAIFIQFAAPRDRDFLFERMKRALRPGGLLLLHGYRPEQVDYGTGGPPYRENMYTEPMLREAFADLEILTLESYDAEIHEGSGHEGMSALIDLVASKPTRGTY